MALDQRMTNPGDIADVFIIGGGINGCGIARDAAGRGLKVVLAEQGDLGHATSSASTKLFHGGLRYLEYFEFRLVREALEERETLLRAMPHISWPMRFVLPYSPDMRFETTTPASRLVTAFMPWIKGRRPAWMIRMGLFLYDNLGGRKILPGTRKIDLSQDPLGRPLKPGFKLGYEYSDCWVQDSRLVVLNARDAKARGATIMPRTRVVSAHREGDLWQIETEHAGQRHHYRAKVLVNAAGPWVGDVIHDLLDLATKDNVRLVRGSHIVVPRIYDHDRCYFFQGTDGRIIFAIPYEQDFTLIGTTDKDHHSADDVPRCTDEERDYLCAFASQYFAKPITAQDVVWSYSGVRPLYDDGARSATAATRDYVLRLDREGAPVLNVFGGKITTYRRLAESALDEIAGFFPNLGGKWTAGVALPGGDFPVDGVAALTEKLRATYLFLSPRWAQRLIRTYGTEAFDMLGQAKSATDLGTDFGEGLSAQELDWLIAHEYVQTGEDVLWRRTRLGLHLSPDAQAAVAAYVAAAFNAAS